MDIYQIVGCADKFMGSLCIECGNKLNDADCSRLLKEEGCYYLYKKLEE